MKQPKSLVSRRTLFAGAGTAGAVAVAATLLPAARQAEPAPQAKEPPQRGGGYHVTDHVRRYYRSTLV